MDKSVIEHVEEYLRNAMDKAREAAMASDEYRTCGFRVGSRVMVEGLKRPCTVSDIIMVYDAETYKPELVVTVRTSRGTERRVDYKSQVASVVEY